MDKMTVKFVVEIELHPIGMSKSTSNGAAFGSIFETDDHDHYHDHDQDPEEDDDDDDEVNAYEVRTVVYIYIFM
jgi:hypothetical protein